MVRAGTGARTVSAQFLLESPLREGIGSALQFANRLELLCRPPPHIQRLGDPRAHLEQAGKTCSILGARMSAHRQVHAPGGGAMTEPRSVTPTTRSAVTISAAVHNQQHYEDGDESSCCDHDPAVARHHVLAPSYNREHERAAMERPERPGLVWLILGAA